MTRIGGGSPGIGTSPHGASPHGMIGVGIGMIWDWEEDWKENWKGESLDKRQEESLDKRPEEEEKKTPGGQVPLMQPPLSKKRNNKGRPAGTGTVSHKRRLHYQQRSYEKRIAREQAEAELKKQEEEEEKRLKEEEDKRKSKKMKRKKKEKQRRQKRKSQG